MQTLIRKWVFTKKTDLPFAEGPTSRFLPWVIGTMVYLIYLLISTALIGHNIIKDWNQYFASRLTIEIPPLVDDQMPENAYKQKTQQIMDTLTHVWPNAKVTLVEKQKIQSLLEPWLGASNLTIDLPLPILIDVDIPAKTQINLSEVSTKLSTIIPGTLIEDHQQWRSMLVGLVKSGEYFGISLGLLLVTAILLMLVFTTHSELVIHKKVINILQIIGAPTPYIARQFQRHALQIGLQAMMVSLALSGVTMLACAYVLYHFDIELSQQWYWGRWMLLSIPLVSALALALKVLTARISSTILLNQG